MSGLRWPKPPPSAYLPGREPSRKRQLPTLDYHIRKTRVVADRKIEPISSSDDDLNMQSASEAVRDVSHLLGQKEWIHVRDPDAAHHLHILNMSEDPEINALLELQNHRIMALIARVSLLESRLSAATSVEQISKYTYAWIKGAEAAGVYKLKQH